MQRVDYSLPVTPVDYQCGGCGATGVKLWRTSQDSSPTLFCAHCAASDQGEDVSTLTPAGRVVRSMDGAFIDHIGDLLPAIPDEQGAGFWGYNSAPPRAVVWWRDLPNTVAESLKK